MSDYFNHTNSFQNSEGEFLEYKIKKLYFINCSLVE